MKYLSRGGRENDQIKTLPVLWGKQTDEEEVIELWNRRVGEDED